MSNLQESHTVFRIDYKENQGSEENKEYYGENDYSSTGNTTIESDFVENFQKLQKEMDSQNIKSLKNNEDSDSKELEDDLEFIPKPNFVKNNAKQQNFESVPLLENNNKEKELTTILGEQEKINVIQPGRKGSEDSTARFAKKYSEEKNQYSPKKTSDEKTISPKRKVKSKRRDKDDPNQINVKIDLNRMNFGAFSDFSRDVNTEPIMDIRKRFVNKSKMFNDGFDVTHNKIKDWLDTGYQNRFDSKDLINTNKNPEITENELQEAQNKEFDSNHHHQDNQNQKLATSHSKATPEKCCNDDAEFTTKLEKKYDIHALNLSQKEQIEKSKIENFHKVFASNNNKNHDEVDEDDVIFQQRKIREEGQNYGNPSNNYKLSIKNSNLKDNFIVSADQDEVNCYMDFGHMIRNLMREDKENFIPDDLELLTQEAADNPLNLKKYWSLLEMLQVLKNTYVPCGIDLNNVGKLKELLENKNKIGHALDDESSESSNDFFETVQNQKINNIGDLSNLTEINTSNIKTKEEKKLEVDKHKTIKFHNLPPKYSTSNNVITPKVEIGTQFIVMNDETLYITESDINDAITEWYGLSDIIKEIVRLESYSEKAARQYENYKNKSWDLIETIQRYQYKDQDKQGIFQGREQLIKYCAVKIVEFRHVYVKKYYIPKVLTTLMNEILFFHFRHVRDKAGEAYNYEQSYMKYKESQNRDDSYFGGAFKQIDDCLVKVGDDFPNSRYCVAMEKKAQEATLLKAVNKFRTKGPKSKDFITKNGPGKSSVKSFNDSNDLNNSVISSKKGSAKGTSRFNTFK